MEGEEVAFEAPASDPEDGELTGEVLVWESRELAGVPMDRIELDGAIGTGTRFSRDDLSFGHHIIIVTATDSEGESATAQIEIGVGVGAPLRDRIVFLRGRFGGPSNIWVMEPDGSNARALGLARGFALDASPDGRFVAYDRPQGRIGPPDIWLRDVVEGWETRLTTSPGRDKIPHFSPDGTKILFWSSRTGTNQIFVMNADGTDVTQVTDDPDAESLEGDWSPDGTRIVYSKLQGDDFRIWVVNAEGTDPRQLANSPGNGDELADWSPDGSVVVFTSARTGVAQIFGIGVDGTGPTPITANPEPTSYPIWVPGQ